MAVDLDPRAGITLKNTGVRLDAQRLDFLVRVRRRLPEDFPVLVITDGDRTYAEQADRMLDKRALGGNKALEDIYGAKVKRLLTLPDEEWTAEIQKAAGEGILFSRHLIRDAFDVRDRDLTDAQRDMLIKALRDEGAHVINEGYPPHIHVDRIHGSTAILPPPPRPRVEGAGSPDYGRGVAGLLLASALIWGKT